MLKDLLTTRTSWPALIFRNRVAKNSLYNGLGFAVQLLLHLVFTPLLVHRMGLENYGLWSIATSALGLMGVFEFGLGTAIAKYVAEYTANRNKEGLSAVATTGFVFNLAIGILLTLPFYFLAPKAASLFPNSTTSSEQIERAIRLVAFGFMPLLLRNGSLAVSRGLQRYEFPTIIKTIQNALTLVAALIVILFNGSIEQVILSTVLLMGGVGLGSLALALGMLRDQVERFSFSWQYSREMFSFMVFAGATGASQQVFRYMDRITVGAVLGLSPVTYYTVLTGIANRLIALSGTLTEALMPAASSWYAMGNRDKLRKYLWRSTGIIALMNLTLGVFLIVFSEMLLRLWMGNEFARQTLASFRILVLIYSLSAMTAPAYHIANGIGVPWTNTLGGMLSGVGTIVLIVVLGRLLELEGAAWANAASWAKFIAVAYVIYTLRRSDQSF